MMRCFCLWQKRCTFGAMCAFGTLHVAHCTFEIALSGAIMLTLLLVCAFSPRVHSFPRSPRIFARNDVKRVARNKKPTKKHPFGCLNIKSPQNGENLIKLYLP